MWENHDDVLAQVQSLGLRVDSLQVNSAKPVRCYVEGGGREKRGWYWLTDFRLPRQAGGEGLYIVGSFGYWQGNDHNKYKVKLNRKGPALTDADKKAIAERHRENARRAKAEREAEIKRAARRAANAWRHYTPEGTSDYLERKRVGAHGVRFAPNGSGTIAIPAMDAPGRVFCLQVIRGKNRGGKLEKQYWPKGAEIAGKWFQIGSPTAGGICLVVEGFATGATLHEATGLPVAVAFAANNLQPVAVELRRAYRGARILVCADDDYIQKCRACKQPTLVDSTVCEHCDEPHGQVNPGITAARAAAVAVSGAWVAPTFPGDRERKKLTDFNDLYHFPDGGLASVRVQVEEAIQRAGWQSVAGGATGAGNPQRGAGGRRAAQSVMSVDDAVERFLPLDDGTGKFVFDTWTRKIAHKDQMLALLPADSKLADVKRHPTWIHRGAYYLDEVGFDPSGKDAAVRLNTWKGWAMEPKQGNCETILAMLEYLCSAEENSQEVYDWLICWMAYPLQNPGAKMSSAVIMHGPQGTGKSAVFQALAQIYGDYSTVLNQRGLEDKFNQDWVESKLFLLAEEVVTRQEMWHIKNELKELVTGDWVRVRPMHMTAYRQRNQINIAYLSNEGQPLPIENDDRRHLVVWTPPQLKEEWYDELWLEIENGGVPALYNYLLNVNLEGWHPKKRPPMTQSKRDLIQLSKPSEDRFLDEWTAGELDHPIGPCGSKHLYTAYQRWCRANGVRFPRESNQFLGRLKKLNGWSSAPKYIYEDLHYAGSPRKQRMVIPPPEVLEKARKAKPADETLQVWLTDCFFAFQRSLEEPGPD
ncbi:putative DNA primase/helicase [Natronocella acetinitrilica]|uniref:DNA primase/helicase n=1 Tax=Natronocella acetinitrilica TaxID=414046 RepID=A0AAE3G5G2_9GAMM|nr:DUF5906 domain-containing protein [Natronocella acetinitrilica]MCP1675473.1 putative DNA primase/helicase [Natronocella acetinitrilica]